MAKGSTPRSRSRSMLRRITVISATLSAATVDALPATHEEVQYSAESDVANQALAIEYFEEKYYNPENKWSLGDVHLKEAQTFAQMAFEQPVLALAAAQVLYLFGWFKRTGEIIRENIVMAAMLFELSISQAGCSDRQSAEEWVSSACDIRFGQAGILYDWLANTDKNPNQMQGFRTKGMDLLKYLKGVPRFKEVSASWDTPLHMNFNQLRFPTVPSQPIWPSKKVPLAVFLEEHYPIFRQELEAIVNSPGDIYEQLRKADGSIESLATPGGWDAVRIVRYGHWFDLFCEVAPQTCALLRTRPELVNCPYVNTNYYKLNPGSHLKPHFGNAPRLTAHLTILAPEPLRAGISVGYDQAMWIEGRALILDDTYPHAVSHWGEKPRYVLSTWFCHPCDKDTDHKQTCPETL
eukprot:TRINITY_DN10774_c0_g1_i1.p1 TRINITY_DN10774_c0_g1~~TRINITY_DN10774_c0_g1_i1.p1  ORF type:complete len:430 (+),score=55.07 TRINITY_DN10774_c0_g1_i1:67-1290(+)